MKKPCAGCGMAAVLDEISRVVGFAPCGGITRIRSKGFPAVCGISASLRQRPCDVLGVWGIWGGKSRGW
jgi:hypothetical protein